MQDSKDDAAQKVAREKRGGVSVMRKDVLAETIEIEDGEADHKFPRGP